MSDSKGIHGSIENIDFLPVVSHSDDVLKWGLMSNGRAPVRISSARQIAQSQ
jgi:hypothetical protein